uniref:Protein kinase domain-containing protein n=1 Tax=Anopheles culicifacies TaxID=139723 RepID=A0A182MAT9_9DIPT
MHKPKRKETVTEILRASVKQLERFRHPKILQIMHTVEESSETLSFATEPVIASLANILAYQVSEIQASVVNVQVPFSSSWVVRLWFQNIVFGLNKNIKDSAPDAAKKEKL